MKDKEKQIKEMAKDLEPFITLHREVYVSANRKERHAWMLSEEDNKVIAEHLISKGWAKLSKDSVVLSREEYEELLKVNKADLAEQANYTRKETAEKIVDIVDNVCEKHIEYAINKIKYRSAEELYCSAVKSFAESFKKELAKQFGVGIKE